MSTRIMSECWPLRMPPTAKAVLISLADNANDNGVCWPSIATICERTCFKKDAVIDAIAWLEKAGAVVANRENGRHTTYTITVSSYVEIEPESRRSTSRAKPPVGQSHQSGKTTGRAKPPVGQNHRPVGQTDTHQSGKTTKPVGQTDTNRQEPSFEPSIEPSTCSDLAVAAAEGVVGELITTPRKGEPTPLQLACSETWEAYAKRYYARYGVNPVRNAKVNSQVRGFVERVGAMEAPEVAAYYVGHNDAYLVRRCHDFGTLLAQAEAMRTQWATGQAVTQARAQQIDRTQTNLSAIEQAKEIKRRRAEHGA